MGNTTISVIVPVYNVSPYLQRCFNSIINQTYSDLEIILVDDGSTDGSGELCDRLAEQDDRVRVFHKPNGGLGSARNVGIQAAKGNYLGFVDSDDWIEPTMYATILKLMQENRAQIGACGIRRVTESGDSSFYNENLQERHIYTTEEALNELPRNERLSNSMCNKLFQRETIVGLIINEQIAYEDNPFTPQCIGRAKTVIDTAEPFYCYYEREGSISRKDFSIKEFDRVKADRMRLDYYHDYFPQCEDSAAIAYIGSCLKLYFNARKCAEASEQRTALKEELRAVIKAYPHLPFTKKQRAKVRLFLLNPALYSLAMTMRGK